MRGAAVEFGDARLPERFWQKVTPCPMTGCWLWTGSHVDGYGASPESTTRRTGSRLLPCPARSRMDSFSIISAAFAAA